MLIRSHSAAATALRGVRLLLVYIFYRPGPTLRAPANSEQSFLVITFLFFFLPLPRFSPAIPPPLSSGSSGKRPTLSAEPAESCVPDRLKRKNNGHDRRDPVDFRTRFVGRLSSTTTGNGRVSPWRHETVADRALTVYSANCFWHLTVDFSDYFFVPNIFCFFLLNITTVSARQQFRSQLVSLKTPKGFCTKL